MMSSKSIILITGANSGIGFSAAKVLSSSAENHLLFGCRSAEKGQNALEPWQELSKVFPGR
jgi:NAD(P)-dependent dehydrogenase (short-subunit alcohol dehydrogenase family)